MKVTVTLEQLAASAELQQVAMFALMNGSSATWDSGKTTYTFDNHGDLMITKDHFALFYISGVKVEKATIFAIIEDSLMESKVPEEFPKSKYAISSDDVIIDEEIIEPVQELRVYSEYFKFKNQLEDESWLVRLVPVEYGSTAGNGLNNDDFRTFWEHFSEDIKTKAEGLAIIAAIPAQDIID